MTATLSGGGATTAAGPEPEDLAAQRSAQDALLRIGRVLLYPGLALSSLLVIRGPAELPVGDILIAAAGLCGAMSLAKPNRSLPVVVWLAGAMLLVGGLLAATVSSDPATSVGIAARLVYLVAVVPAVLLTLLVERRHLTQAVIWWLGGAALCALGVVVQLVLGDVIPGGDITADNRFTGFTTHPSDLAGVTATAAGATLAALTGGLDRRTRNWALAIVVACAVGLLFSGSVSGMFGLIGSVVYLFVRRAVRLRRATVIATGGSVLVSILISRLAVIGARNPVDRFLLTTGFIPSHSDSDTAATRIELARRAISGIGDSPWLGHGLVALDNLLLKNFTVHNNLLGAWMAGGILVFAGVLTVTVVALRYCLRRDGDDVMRNVVGAAVVGAFVFAQTAPGIYNRYYWMPIAFAIVLMVRSRSARRTDASPGRSAAARV